MHGDFCCRSQRSVWVISCCCFPSLVTSAFRKPHKQLILIQALHMLDVRGSHNNLQPAILAFNMRAPKLWQDDTEPGAANGPVPNSLNSTSDGTAPV